ncbi:sulfurtransferase complex subunit TusC [Aliikangiella marina]|uniref:Sulfurtransferase complex subunit TusC n=1 Tax=Aliikangiella marina TaxID=1712262 RepID=A0A545THE3_9GAMM|nr:sulfurtransferase complex subunit TusC [Aliikangiella marina]TQV76632.1 sulfurtransferase complex subunit TusC [Aliikangiella marina]
METTNTTIIIASPPFGKINGKEGVDLALVCAAFEQNVQLVFVDEGVFHLLTTQEEAFFDDKFHDAQLKALEFYDIERVHVEKESLAQFGLTQQQLIDNTSINTRAEIHKMVLQSTHTVRF